MGRSGDDTAEIRLETMLETRDIRLEPRPAGVVNRWRPRVLCVLPLPEQLALVQLGLEDSSLVAGAGGCTRLDEAIARLPTETFDCAFVGAAVVADWMAALTDYGLNLPTIALVESDQDSEMEDCWHLGVVDCLALDQVNAAQLRRCFTHLARMSTLERQNKTLSQNLQQLGERYQLTLDVSKDGIWDWAIAQQEIQGNRRLWEMLGLSAEAQPLTFNDFKARIHPLDYPVTKEAFRRYLQDRLEFSVETRLLHGEGGYRDFWIRGQLQRGNDSDNLRMYGLISDITERKQGDRRNRFLSQASSLLNASLDAQTTLENLAWLAVPRIADWCILEINLKKTGEPALVISHGNPLKESLVQQFYYDLKRQSIPPHSPQYAYHLTPEDKQQLHRQQGWSLETLELLNFQSYVWIPLQVGALSLGSIFFAWGGSGRHCMAEDLALLQELAYRATWSIENTRLYGERQAVYLDLQRAIAQLTTQQRRLKTLQHLTTLVNRRLTNIPELLEGLVGQICKDVPAAQVCSIALYDKKQEGDFFVVTDGLHKQAIAISELLKQDNNWLQQVYQAGKPFLRDFDVHDPLPCSMAAVAIESVASGRLGVLVVGNWQIAQAFSPEDCEFLSAVGEEAAIAIDNARLIKTLEQQNQELSETSRVKDLFLATVSHELRTPMNAILGFSQVLLRQRQNSLGKSEQQILQRILSNGRSLMALINDILDFSQMKLSALKLMPSAFNLHALAQDIVAELQSLADEKQLFLQLDNQLQDAQIIHDQKRLRQVLINLVANALSFTQRGTVTIRLRDNPGQEPEQIIIEVHDTGIGIAPEHLEHIFQEFWQVQQDMHRSKSGTGLGLAITYGLVQRMHGAIAVESDPGKGSKFEVTLPRILVLEEDYFP